MAPSNESGINGNGQASQAVVGEGAPMPAYLSTEPKEGQSWQITLKDKVIAITGVCLPPSQLEITPH
jgi:hypothetical protein